VRQVDCVPGAEHVERHADCAVPVSVMHAPVVQGEFAPQLWVQ
jgi:hypothetical protein